MTDDAARLLATQQQLEAESGGRVAFVGRSVDGTLAVCLENGMGKRAERVRADFKVPDKRCARARPRCPAARARRFWHVKLRALTAARDWDALDAFAKAKRSPIGYAPFVRHLVSAGFPREAAGYVARCEPPVRADLYVECGDWRAAGRACKERGDKAKLECVGPARAWARAALMRCGLQAAQEDVSELAHRARVGAGRGVDEMIPWCNTSAFSAMAGRLAET
jgi:hypothetical protein